MSRTENDSYNKLRQNTLILIISYSIKCVSYAALLFIKGEDWDSALLVPIGIASLGIILPISTFFCSHKAGVVLFVCSMCYFTLNAVVGDISAIIAAVIFHWRLPLILTLTISVLEGQFLLIFFYSFKNMVAIINTRQEKRPIGET